MDHDSMAQSPAPRPLCGCKKQRTDRGSRLGGALLGLYSRAGFSAAEIRFRVRQRRELGIERFRRVGLCTEESDAATLPPGDVLPRTDTDRSWCDLCGGQADSAAAGEWPLWHPMRETSRQPPLVWL
nr:unnamed protein product [Leishmania braziliensis]